MFNKYGSPEKQKVMVDASDSERLQPDVPELDEEDNEDEQTDDD